MSFSNLDNDELTPQASKAIINNAGILPEITYKGVQLTDHKSKNKPGEVNKAAEFLFEDSLGRQHRELYFKPPTSVDKVTFEVDKYEEVDGKLVKVRKLTKEEMLIGYGNDVVFFLLDLADALGFNYDTAKANVGKAKSFEDAIEIFKKQYPPDPKKKINMKLLWDNSKKNQTTFLKLRVGILV
jgi:hypothetical protein